jgi:ferrous iron transport protein B
LKIALIGQPNSGKSTIFNSVAGYKSVTSNLPGTTVNYTESRVRLNGNIYDLVDFPGTYSLSSTNEAEAEVSKYLLWSKFDLIINVIDASQLGRSLPLTLELLELKIPIILALNMIDEATRKGISIDTEKLSRILGTRVQSTVASKNLGIRDLFISAKQVIENGSESQLIHCQRDVEEVILEMDGFIREKFSGVISHPSRFIAIKLLEDDEYYRSLLIRQNGTELSRKIEDLQKKLVELRGKPQDSVMLLERHAMAMDIYRQTVQLGTPRQDWREKLDDLLMHRIGGYFILVLVLLAFFYGVFQIGALLEGILLSGFAALEELLSSYMQPGRFTFQLLKSILWGISGGLAIVLPYLLPFLVGLNLLEDVGYLSRVAFLMDALMHKIGLHGTAIIPAVLGYGCNVPAVMATRILPSRRDKIIAAVIASMVPCSARSIVILGLVAFYLGPLWAFGVYLLNIVMVAGSGKVLSLLMPEVTPGMILEIPSYRWPALRVIGHKTWFRIKEFVVVAWPILIAGSVLLGLLEYFELDRYVNAGLSPLTALLGLPAVVGTTLIFGVLRKELALIMLTQAIGTTEILTVLTQQQILTFTIFITFYIPCVATMAVLSRELNRSLMIGIILFSLLLAFFLALLVNQLGNLFF